MWVLCVMILCWLNGCNNLLSNITIDFVWQAQGFQVSMGTLSFEMFWKVSAGPKLDFLAPTRILPKIHINPLSKWCHAAASHPESLCSWWRGRPSEDLQLFCCRYGVKLQVGFHLPGSGQICLSPPRAVSCFCPGMVQDHCKLLQPLCATPQGSVSHVVAFAHPWCWWLARCPLLNVQMWGLA